MSRRWKRQSAVFSALLTDEERVGEMRLDVWIILNIIIILFGIYMITAWAKMKKTGKVNERLLMRNGLMGRPCRDKQGYFEAVFRPTLIFGLGSIGAGGVSLICELLRTGEIVITIMTFAFLAIALWYCKQVSDATKKYYL